MSWKKCREGNLPAFNYTNYEYTLIPNINNLLVHTLYNHKRYARGMLSDMKYLTRFRATTKHMQEKLSETSNLFSGNQRHLPFDGPTPHADLHSDSRLYSEHWYSNDIVFLHSIPSSNFSFNVYCTLFLWIDSVFELLFCFLSSIVWLIGGKVALGFCASISSTIYVYG